jgi:hypothetical protein
MAAITSKTRDGKLITDGAYAELTLLHGERSEIEHGAYERTLKGIVRAFDQDGETRWEISTDDPQHPAIGFLPESVLTRSGG